MKTGNKRKYFFPLLVGAVTLVVTSGVILAQNNSSQENDLYQEGVSFEIVPEHPEQFLAGDFSKLDTPFDGDLPQISASHGGDNETITARVAEILGVEEDALKEAYAQAIREKQNEALSYKLDHLVDNDKLSREEANEILNWFEGRPNFALKLHRVLLRGEDAVAERLNRMVEHGVITREQADEVLSWYSHMPQVLQDLLEERRSRQARYNIRPDGRPSDRFSGQGFDRPNPNGRPFGEEGFDRPGNNGRPFGRDGNGRTSFESRGAPHPGGMMGARGQEPAGMP